MRFSPRSNPWVYIKCWCLIAKKCWKLIAIFCWKVLAVYNRFYDTGRVSAFRCDWQEGQPKKPHIFWDSDVAKWIEGAAYLIEKQPDAKLEALID